MGENTPNTLGPILSKILGHNQNKRVFGVSLVELLENGCVIRKIYLLRCIPPIH
jgi:hypothetical protein